MCWVCKKRSSAITLLDTIAGRIGAAASSWVKARPVNLVLFMHLNFALLLLYLVVLILLHGVVMWAVSTIYLHTKYHGYDIQTDALHVETVP